MLPVEPQRPSLRYRLIIVQTDGRRVLAVHQGGHVAFPEVEISARERVAAQLVAAARHKYGQDIFCLFPLSADHENEIASPVRYFVAEAVGRGSAVTPTWISVDSLHLESFAQPKDYEALHCSLGRCGANRSPLATHPFEKLGWFSDVRTWIADTLKSFGLQLAGSFRQLTASSSFSLIHFDTSGPGVWFKAVGQPNLHEFPVTRRLALCCPDYLPNILAFHPVLAAWLMQSASDTTLRETDAVGTWCSAAALLARLQRETISLTDTLLEAGCRDLRTQTLLDGCDSFFDHAGTLMEQQTTTSPQPLSFGELSNLSLTAKSALRALQAIRIPETLGHGDLNPSNVLVQADRCVFTDWAEAYVGHPFFSFEYLRRSFRRFRSPDPASEAALTSAYLEQWSPVLAPHVARRALTYTPLLATFAYAVRADAWRGQPIRQLDGARWVRSLTRTMREQAHPFSEVVP